MADQAPQRLSFLVLGHSPEGATRWPHPATISVHPRGRTTLLNFSLGPHIINAGGQVRLSAVVHNGELNETFAEEFDACQARWLVPYLARLAAGQDVEVSELIGAYQQRFGQPPRTEQSAEYRPSRPGAE